MWLEVGCGSSTIALKDFEAERQNVPQTLLDLLSLLCAGRDPASSPKEEEHLVAGFRVDKSMSSSDGLP